MTFGEPRGQHRVRGVEHDDGVRVRRRDGVDQVRAGRRQLGRRRRSSSRAAPGSGVLEVAPTPSLTNTSASFLPTAAAAASVMSPFAREYAKRKLAGVHGAGTAGHGRVGPCCRRRWRRDAVRRVVDRELDRVEARGQRRLRRGAVRRPGLQRSGSGRACAADQPLVDGARGRRVAGDRGPPPARVDVGGGRVQVQRRTVERERDRVRRGVGLRCVRGRERAAQRERRVRRGRVELTRLRTVQRRRERRALLDRERVGVRGRHVDVAAPCIRVSGGELVAAHGLMIDRGCVLCRGGAVDRQVEPAESARVRGRRQRRGRHRNPVGVVSGDELERP